MKSVYNFVVTPKGKRYNNTKKIGDKELVLNTDVYNHQYTNREAIVISTPIIGDTDIKPGDTIVVHHNVFRRWHNIEGLEKNSRSYFDENTYLVNYDQIFLYKQYNDWKASKGYCFVQPIKDTNQFSIEVEKPLIGIVKNSPYLMLLKYLIESKRKKILSRVKNLKRKKIRYLKDLQKEDRNNV
jgi:hypothetical protein